MSGDRVRVVIAEDHPIYRDGLSRALGWNHDIEVVAAVADGEQALVAAREHAPCVLMVDYNLPGRNGVQVADAVTRDGLDCRVLLISATTDGPVVFEALERGAAGYLGKDADRDQIIDAVLRVARGQAVLPPEVATGLAGQIRMRGGQHRPVLTDREREVLRSFAAGLTIPQVARNLHLSPSTVKSHTQRLYEKLGVGDRAAVVAEAMRRGLLE
ncbi:two component transcriptional regulator, LuxR family [Streptoalloteichus tenebrarius]|uniref:Two component transcriptional regulator, LuxR family n=1 Tax=Streptoalloteichus tenebrarius (strain ATCC 17920 / DSM 40477 / JCM 4838 / CBS 697.72 / NBRC 16177 / NCIMB 11028 / NRRL B-12390 / A12253. 1 / ISP 5477) TaxID=1933 RepID=A0ABT1HZ48_STRSD|nr:response regulator transcription factor [Streptoalloteichus tenebrarius]MCP2260788.1 two component transcriptional regulator, LuxR family [Streptoalloteichus tenebrarius]BFF03396.1 response regulator transcription factor [Streptoalloteichus tenebrarius]